MIKVGTMKKVAAWASTVALAATMMATLGSSASATVTHSAMTTMSIGHRKAMTANDLANQQHIVWAVAHEDDLTLIAGASFVQHAEAKQADGSPLYDLHVLVASDGQSSGVLPLLNANANGRYAPLTSADFIAARAREEVNGLTELLAGTGNSATLTFGHQVDGSISVAETEYEINSIASVDPNHTWWLKGHSWYVDPEQDHRNVGLALKALGPTLADGNVRYYMLPSMFTSPLLADVGGGHPIKPAATTLEYKNTINAYKAYCAWAPPQGMYAIGCTSVPKLFIVPVEDMYHV